MIETFNSEGNTLKFAIRTFNSKGKAKYSTTKTFNSGIKAKNTQSAHYKQHPKINKENENHGFNKNASCKTIARGATNAYEILGLNQLTRITLKVGGEEKKESLYRCFSIESSHLP
ncbi:hypothetical protein [Draconibacterium sp.]|uniref:hypothetical protein n=1 Tax=Draconibacterium sp. TaxID=1965318 RepID=UPI0035628834